MLQFRTKRQKSTPDYKKLFKDRPFLVSKYFSIWVGNSENTNFARFGVVVAKKNVKTAVARNKCKRIAREIFKDYRKKLAKKDVVLVIKKFEAVHKLSSLCVWKEKLIGVYSWLEHFISGG